MLFIAPSVDHPLPLLGDAGPARTALRTPAAEAFAAGLVPRPAARRDDGWNVGWNVGWVMAFCAEKVTKKTWELFKGAG